MDLHELKSGQVHVSSGFALYFSDASSGRKSLRSLHVLFTMNIHFQGKELPFPC